MKKVFHNPKIKDKVTVLKTAEETNGDYILVEVELAAGGGVGMHYHKTFNETFIPVDGVLGVDVRKKKLRLHQGEMVVARMNEAHRFYNPGKSTIRFNVKIAPAQNRFLETLSIAYGLASDGEVNSKGVPKRFDHIAVLTAHSDTNITGLYSFIKPILMHRAKKAIRKGVLKELQDKYCQ